MNKNILIAGGGTFGHIAPALALKHYFTEKGFSVFYVCAEKDKRFPFYQKEKNILTIRLFGMPRKNILAFFRFIFYVFLSLGSAFRHFRKIKPVAIIATGGFVAFPYLFWSRILRKPYFICEQNSFPGIVNRLFSASAKAVFLSMRDFSKKIKGNIFITGNPISLNHYENKSDAMKKLGIELPSDKKILGVVGGSQGALQINQWIINNQEKLEEEGFCIILSTGKENFTKMQENKRIHSLFIFDFIEDMGAFYTVCDCFICRAGASSISELLLVNKPVIFIPYPYATDNHQYYNALFAQEYLPATIVLEKEILNTDLISTLKNLVNTEKKEKENNFFLAKEKIFQEVIRWI